MNKNNKNIFHKTLSANYNYCILQKLKPILKPIIIISMKILAGLSHKKLARYLAEELNCKYVKTYITTFDDAETRVEILEDMYKCDVVIVQSTSRPANNHLMELLLLVDTVKRAGASQVTAVIPYFGYSRQDRSSCSFTPVSSRLVASMLEVAGVNHVITVDLHSQQLEGFFKIPLQNLDPISLFAPIIETYNNSIIVSPDVGGFVRVRDVNRLFNMNIAVINKSRDVKRYSRPLAEFASAREFVGGSERRTAAYSDVREDSSLVPTHKLPAEVELCKMSNDKCQISEIIGNVSGKHCILIDDIVDSGETLCKGAKLLMEVGALSVNAFITHPVLSSMSKENIQNSDIMNVL
ncbi:ribose-phosphate diphosphokinase [Candidatus Tisiphia endosymbiont of Myopa tessellatipennis]|uniref:ribose-phosphate diphosphokinase n=1 Tax=Candidatus Tisiphia endosymbiont of Myopa tessellatipennis TaxID=3066257 RepID=UPI00313C4B20